ncbi:MAG TPA: type I DNA topoisomerase, partial [Patescibacteria group bacterium]
MELVIVESPTKARTLTGILPKKYKIVASMGHVRDLPKSELGIDVEKNFQPRYIIPKDKKKAVNQLVKLMQEADKLYLATDPDREGEAISWHLLKLAQDKDKGKKAKVGENSKPVVYQRVTFHEITSQAVKEAFDLAHDLDHHLIDAQQARRVLDRLVGYQISPILWKKIKRGLSAGRVQSVALRLIVEREREIEIFKQVEFWKLEAILKKETNGTNEFSSWLIEKENKKLIPKNKKETDQILKDLGDSIYKVGKVVKKEVKRNSTPPFTTSTLQQAASSKFGFPARTTMSLAQNLYEEGLITYHRTDSVNLAEIALGQIRKFIGSEFGPGYLPKVAKKYKTRSKLAQEAHEAIRPTKTEVTSDKLQVISDKHKKLYDLIWKKTVASQMNEAIFDQTSVDVLAKDYTFRATGQVIKFDGWLKVYGVEDDEDKKEDEKSLPELTEGEILDLVSLNPTQHFTEPPPRYTEATLIKILEQNGIGRPSTYAPIISTILDRYYVEREERKLKPTTLGITVNDFLIEHF